MGRHEHYFSDFSDFPKDDMATRLGIQKLKEEDLVSDFKVITVNTTPGVSYLEDKVLP